MKIKLTINNTKIRISYDGKISSYEEKDIPAEAAFYEFDLDTFCMMQKMFLQNIFGYYSNVCGAIEKPININNLTNENSSDSPKILPANGHDIYNYIARFGIANFQIQTIMKLDGRLDRNKLLKAVRLSLDAEPILGCRFIENAPPYWEKLDSIDESIFCTFEETDNVDEAVQRFLESPLDMDNDPMVKLKLISSGPYDTLCIKINHACTDGTGTKEYLKLLSDIYSCIEQSDDLLLKPSVRTRKDQDKLFSKLGIKNPETVWDASLDAPKNMWEFPWQPGQPDIARIAVCQLPHGHINNMYRYGKSKGATINDLLLTAFYRAMFQMSQPPYGVPMDISLTVDLRRYLPNQKAEAIRCFSGAVNTKLARIENESFEGTLYRIIPMMNEIKDNRPGLQSAIGLERIEKENFNDTLDFYRTAEQNHCYSNKCTPVLSNLSFINKSLLKFGENVVTDAYIIPPAICAPGLLLCVGTYNDIITMAISYYEPQVCRENVAELLNLVGNELLEACKL